ncbi:MAG: hypothetical protein JJU11_07120 [Candidatus Sumerlaeia bacterium]|nr:hypothetical protein [Candidatus Sumerlaeia bacterium]
MTTTELTSRERELEDFLSSHPEPVLVYLTEDFHPAALDVLNHLHAANNRRWKVVEIPLHACRNWAARNGIHGSPSILVYKKGRLVTALLGVMEADDIRDHLERVGT